MEHADRRRRHADTADATGTLEILGQSLDMTTLQIDGAHVHVVHADRDARHLEARCRCVDGADEAIAFYTQQKMTMTRWFESAADAHHDPVWKQK